MSFETRIIFPNTIYRHFKGNHYYVVGFCKHSETNESMVLYRGLSTGELYCRPYAMFNSPVDKKKYPEVEQYWRFEEVDLGEDRETTDSVNLFESDLI